MTAKPTGCVDVTPIERAIDAWTQALGEGAVVTETARYSRDTSSFAGSIPVALRPTSTEQVQQVVRIAQTMAIPIYPISTGNNWGYGTSVPVRSPAALVDLSSMNRILGFDEQLSAVTVEPGVTQAHLSEYLRARGLRFLVPVTGAGPSCSLLANALERGFGITPLTDHFGAILSMKVVLPDGSLYESYMRNFDLAGGARAFKWGMGPYLDGLFSQSNLGIVVDATIALQPRPERTGVLFFTLGTAGQVEAATASIGRLLVSTGHNIGGINIMSRSRLEAMAQGAARLNGSAGSAPGRRASIPQGAWFGCGSVYGTREHYAATCRVVRRVLGDQVRHMRIYSAGDIRRLGWLSAALTAGDWRGLTDLVDRATAALHIIDGVPSTFAMTLAYAKSGCATGRELNPARDGCGLFWYAPIVPLRTGVVGQFIQFAERTCSTHGFAAPITFTTLSSRCYAATVPLLFDLTDSEAESRARACFDALYRGGLLSGFVPYRIGSPFMAALGASVSSAGGLVRAIKAAVDTNGVLAPGRYSFD